MVKLAKVFGATALALAFGTVSAGAAGAATTGGYDPNPAIQAQHGYPDDGPVVRDHRTP